MVHLLLDYKADPNHFEDDMCQCRPLHWHACRDNLFHYSDICSPMTALTGKGVPFDWTSGCDRAFAELKKLLRAE
jgi:hypothetical protein